MTKQGFAEEDAALVRRLFLRKSGEPRFLGRFYVYEAFFGREEGATLVRRLFLRKSGEPRFLGRFRLL
jgi:hypothetical protein